MNLEAPSTLFLCSRSFKIAPVPSNKEHASNRANSVLITINIPLSPPKLQSRVGVIFQDCDYPYIWKGIQERIVVMGDTIKSDYKGLLTPKVFLGRVHYFHHYKQECIPVGCIPSAAVAISPRGVLPQCMLGCPPPLEQTPPGSRPPGQTPPPQEQTPPRPGTPLGADPPNQAPPEQTPLETCCKACWDTTCNACWDSPPPPNGDLLQGIADGKYVLFIVIRTTERKWTRHPFCHYWHIAKL